jgi:hypothetical protein
MGKEQRRIRLTTATVKNPDSGETELAVRAQTNLGQRTVSAQGADEPGALRALQAKLVQEQKRAEFRSQYPKTVEVDW